MKSRQTIYKSHNLKFDTLAVVVVINLFLIVSSANAWGKAIWPFNTPTMATKQICNNSRDWAVMASRCHNQKSRTDLLAQLNTNKKFSIKNDPKYKKWKLIYYREIELCIKTVWRNPDITEDMAIKITQNICKSRSKEIKKEFEQTNPKK